MQELIISLINQFGYLGILFLILIENVFPPIPSEVILTFSGFMTTYTNMSVLGVIIFSTIGSVFGAILLYGIGRFLDKDKMIKIIDGKVGKLLKLKNKDINKAEAWFEKKGPITVLICRFVPIVRSLISIPAGMVKMKFSLFLILTIIGTSVWNIVLVFVGSILGENWQEAVVFMDKYSKTGLVILLISFIVGVVVFYTKRLYKKKI